MFQKIAKLGHPGGVLGLTKWGGGRERSVVGMLDKLWGVGVDLRAPTG